MDKFPSRQNDFYKLTESFDNLSSVAKAEVTRFIFLEIAHGTDIGTAQLMQEIKLAAKIHVKRGLLG